jgi:hypothetical protein
MSDFVIPFDAAAALLIAAAIGLFLVGEFLEELIQGICADLREGRKPKSNRW